MSPRPISLKFNKRRLSGFTGNQLKMIAFVLMLCDHVGYVLIENGVLYGQNPMYWNLALQTAEGQRWYLIARILRFIGRLSFPIFAFLTAEGYAHTKNVRNYITRLFIFACISEVPFDLAVWQVPWYPDYQNVIFTMLLGVIAMWAMDRVKKHVLLQFAAAGICCAAGYYLKCDYGAIGVAMIAAIYLMRNDRKLCVMTTGVIAAAESYAYSGVAALSCIFIWFYNGKRGELAMKYFFYIAYPLHLLLFYAMVYFANR